MWLQNFVSYILVLHYLIASSSVIALIKREAPLAESPSQPYLPASEGFSVGEFGMDYGATPSYAHNEHSESLGAPNEFDIGSFGGLDGFGTNGGPSEDSFKSINSNSPTSTNYVTPVPSSEYGSPFSGGYSGGSFSSQSSSSSVFGSSGSGGVGSSGFGWVAPTQSYGAPSPPLSQYGAPSQTTQSYGAPFQSYGPPNTLPSQYSAPLTSSQSYGPPSLPSQSYGVPSQPLSQYGTVPPEPLKISQSYGLPSQSYGVPSQPSSQYGFVPPEPSKLSQTYGPPSLPSQSYGVPNQPSSQYSIVPPKPSKPSQSYGTPSVPSQTYGIPNQPPLQYGAPVTPSSSYGTPSFPSQSYGAPANGRTKSHKSKSGSGLFGSDYSSSLNSIQGAPSLGIRGGHGKGRSKGEFPGKGQFHSGTFGGKTSGFSTEGYSNNRTPVGGYSGGGSRTVTNDFGLAPSKLYETLSSGQNYDSKGGYKYRRAVFAYTI